MILVAGIGNELLGDDGFGPEVVRRLAAERPVPSEWEARDFGTRELDLALALSGTWRAALVVDSTQLGDPPGTLRLHLPDQAAAWQPDGHAGLAHTLVLAQAWRSTPLPVHVLTCEVSEVPEDPAPGLSPAVAAAVAPALAWIGRWLAATALVHRDA